MSADHVVDACVEICRISSISYCLYFSSLSAEKALRLTEMGFCFNASDRFRGNKRHRTHELTAAEELQQQQQQLQQHQLQHQHDQHQQHYHMQEMVHVPQGFQPYI